MGQQASIQADSIQQTGIQTEPSQWDSRARGGCGDITGIMQQIRDEFGTQGIKDVENKIYYLAAHGSYDRKVGMISIPSGLTIIHLTAFSSSISNVLAQEFAQLSTEMKIAMLRHPNCARNVLQDLEESMTRRSGGKYREDKSWKDRDQLSLVMYQNEAPDMNLNFCGELSSISIEEIKSSGESQFFMSGLTHKESTSGYVIEVEQKIGNISVSDPRAEGILKELLYENKEDQPLIKFFLDRLKSGKYSTIGHVMQVYLSELAINGLLPSEGYLFMSACRYCKHPPLTVRVGGEHGRKVYEKDLQALSTEPLIDAPLENSCSQINCSQRILSLDPRADYNFQNTVCKTSGYGCSVCNDYGNCVSCRDSNSVVILPNGKMHDFCSICFTIEEILGIGERFYYSNVKTYDDILGVDNLPTEFVPNPIFPSDCKIDSRIIKFCLVLKGNPNQVIFYSRAISTDQQFTQTLYIILCFRYIDFGKYKYLNNFGHEVSKIRFTNVFLQNNTIAVQFVEDINKFLETADITSFLAITEQYYNVMVEKEYEQEQVKINRRSKRDRPY